MNKTDDRYDIDTDSVMFAGGEQFDVSTIGAAQTPWWNRTLCEVNNAWVRLGVMEGDFHWHKHDDTDEFFLVMEGHLDIELENQMISLKPGQAFTVPKGVMHCPHARVRSVVLMIEQTGVVPTGD
jgi:mannose-6-phosphate isomerase-like protein (cupin superfamily)